MMLEFVKLTINLSKLDFKEKIFMMLEFVKLTINLSKLDFKVLLTCKN